MRNLSNELSFSKKIKKNNHFSNCTRMLMVVDADSTHGSQQQMLYGPMVPRVERVRTI